MKIRTSSDWREDLPFETPVRAADALPGDPGTCALCPTGTAPYDRSELWAVKHRHPNNHAGFVRLYCTTHRPAPPAPAAAAPARRSAPPRGERRPAAPQIPERVAAVCPNCFIEVPPTGVCGNCGEVIA